MLIGEAPGRDEDLRASPSSAAPGNCSTACWPRSGLPRARLHHQHRLLAPPRQPHADARRRSRPARRSLRGRSSCSSPQVLVLLGGAAAKTILGMAEGIMRLRGKWLNYRSGDRDVATLATLHPAYLLRNPAQSGSPGATCSRQGEARSNNEPHGRDRREPIHPAAHRRAHRVRHARRRQTDKSGDAARQR